MECDMAILVWVFLPNGFGEHHMDEGLLLHWKFVVIIETTTGEQASSLPASGC